MPATLRAMGRARAATLSMLMIGSLLSGLLLSGTGCVRRTLTINTVPQGARVWLNGEEVGKSPVSVDFLWYGDYDVTARMESYQTLNTNQQINEPWYQIAGIDFFTEVLWPFQIHDERTMNFALLPEENPDRAKLLEAAEVFRDRTLNRED